MRGEAQAGEKQDKKPQKGGVCGLDVKSHGAPPVSSGSDLPLLLTKSQKLSTELMDTQVPGRSRGAA
jgi:hypothetical protein